MRCGFETVFDQLSMRKMDMARRNEEGVKHMGRAGRSKEVLMEKKCLCKKEVEEDLGFFDDDLCEDASVDGMQDEHDCEDGMEEESCDGKAEERSPPPGIMACCQKTHFFLSVLERASSSD